MKNQSSLSEFLLLEFSAIRELQILHFFSFLVLYLAIVSGNLLIISAVVFDHHLHTPMYFFLMNLAMQNIGSVSVIIPKSIINSLMNIRHISYSGCVAQVLLFIFVVTSDVAFLTVMACDRYVAICNPLHYEVIMSRRTCDRMAARAWISTFLYAVLHTCGTFAIPFCSNVIDQFFCEVPQLLKLACSDLYLYENGIVAFGAMIGFGCFTLIMVSYAKIFSAVRKIPTVQGRKKAFSTCLPHLIVLFLFIFTAWPPYLKPSPNMPSYINLAITMLYSVVPPLINPVIYSMRNKEMKNALSKLLGLK
ncbi:olfactory receptor 14A16-like [Varanus komodoensis]|uniref:olfactory receptor 14A16-like n=1 Tax=Varanus komodoensis TaxID=61221 RepID=UPI001CF78633|nr:olfactory receptor 14A16-like [Varanus komodoensis]